MTQNHFTVIIPTRERIDTLRWCLETCIRQDYENLRIIVSDNACTDGTGEMLAEMAADPDNRIEHIRTPERVGMSDNFEFALQHVLRTGPKNSYITMIGDDDGISPNAFSHWNEVVNRHPSSKAFTWPMCYYAWENCIDTATPNTLVVSVESDERTVDLTELRELICSFKKPYSDAAKIYYGLVHSDALRELGKRGRIVGSMIPDVYIGYALTFILDHMIYSPYPLSFVGSSKHSTGHLQITGGKPRAKKATNDWFGTEANLEPHSIVARVPSSLRMCELEVLSQLQDKGFPVPELNPREFLDSALSEARSLSPIKGAQVIDDLQEISERNRWSSQFSEVDAKNAGEFEGGASAPDRRDQAISINVDQRLIVVDGFSMNVKNVCDAASILGLLLGAGDPEVGVGQQLIASGQRIDRLSERLQQQFEISQKALEREQGTQAAFGFKNPNVVGMFAGSMSWKMLRPICYFLARVEYRLRRFASSFGS